MNKHLASDSKGTLPMTPAQHLLVMVALLSAGLTLLPPQAFAQGGLPLWTNIYTGPGGSNSRASAAAVDGSGNMFVTGSSIGAGGNYDYATIKYSGAGVPLWTNRYNGPGNR